MDEIILSDTPEYLSKSPDNFICLVNNFCFFYVKQLMIKIICIKKKLKFENVISSGIDTAINKTKRYKTSTLNFLKI